MFLSPNQTGRGLELSYRHEADVIINLTPRYRNREFPWKEVYQKYGSRAAFVGSKDEHAQFVTHYGPIPTLRHEGFDGRGDGHQSSKLFIGNQSCPLSAHAMHHPTFCEYSRNACNGMVRRSTALERLGKNITLPEI